MQRLLATMFEGDDDQAQYVLTFPEGLFYQDCMLGALRRQPHGCPRATLDALARLLRAHWLVELRYWDDLVEFVGTEEAAEMAEEYCDPQLLRSVMRLLRELVCTGEPAALVARAVLEHRELVTVLQEVTADAEIWPDEQAQLSSRAILEALRAVNEE